MEFSKKLAIIMFGAPGSGKGSQGEILREKTKFKSYIMSSLIKEELVDGSPLYDKIKSGLLVDDVDIFNIFRSKFNFEKNVIFDGIPRTLDQAFWIYGFLVSNNYNIKFVNLNVDQDKLINRITARYFCPKCGALYNSISKKSKVEGICDVDGVKLKQRTDDTEEVLSQRLKIFNTDKDKILKIFKKNLINIDGDKFLDEVSEEIFKKVIKN